MDAVAWLLIGLLVGWGSYATHREVKRKMKQMEGLKQKLAANELARRELEQSAQRLLGTLEELNKKLGEK